VLEFDFDMDGKLISGRRDPPEEIFSILACIRQKRMRAR
jgi:hypothetical protein